MTITPKEILDFSDPAVWEKFCDFVGLDYYCVNEGMNDDEEFELTNEQYNELKEMGFQK